jgi:hypothetical protein
MRPEEVASGLLWLAYSTWPLKMEEYENLFSPVSKSPSL